MDGHAQKNQMNITTDLQGTYCLARNLVRY